MSGKLRVATYSRVSTAKHQSTDAQVAELKRYCESRGWEVAHEIVDHGYSGGTDQRPGLKELLSLVRRREVDAVVVTKLDRLFRSLKHLVVTLDEWEQLGTVFVAVRDSLDWSTSAGKLMVQILGSLAEFERSLIRERVSAGLQHAREKGKRLGRPRSDKEDEILKLRSQGFSHREIHRRLQVSKGLICRVLKRAPEMLLMASAACARKQRGRQ
jgi:putative DNA-invertase from lambdoid prophage Rac